LFEAYRKLDQFDDTRPLSPWLFRVAHNRCIDFLRHCAAGREAVANVVAPEATMPIEPVSLGIGKAVEHLVLTLRTTRFSIIQSLAMAFGEALCCSRKKTAVIYWAGGAIGGTVARAFGKEGAKAFLAGRNLTSVAATAKEVVAAGGTAEAAQVDALDENAVQGHMSETSNPQNNIV
jgi:hypothetical protein